jgi:hypothetical protein
MTKAGYGKQKGSEFERQICKSLSLWVSKGKRDDLYWRSAMSGGRATVQGKRGKVNTSQVGDISCIDPEGQELVNKYVIECKNYKDLHIESLIYGTPKNGSILEFWNVLCILAKGVNKLPMLIAKQNQKPAIVLLTHNSYLIGPSVYFQETFLVDNALLFPFDMLLKMEFEDFIK